MSWTCLFLDMIVFLMSCLSIPSSQSKKISPKGEKQHTPTYSDFQSCSLEFCTSLCRPLSHLFGPLPHALQFGPESSTGSRNERDREEREGKRFCEMLRNIAICIGVIPSSFHVVSVYQGLNSLLDIRCLDGKQLKCQS